MNYKKMTVKEFNKLLNCEDYNLEDYYESDSIFDFERFLRGDYDKKINIVPNPTKIILGLTLNSPNFDYFKNDLIQFITKNENPSVQEKLQNFYETENRIELAKALRIMIKEDVKNLINLISLLLVLAKRIKSEN